MSENPRVVKGLTGQGRVTGWKIRSLFMKLYDACSFPYNPGQIEFLVGFTLQLLWWCKV